MEKTRIPPTSSFQFSDPRLTNLHYDINPSFSPLSSDNSIEITTDFKIERGKDANGQTPVTLTVSLNKDAKEALFTLELTLSALFCFIGDFTGDKQKMLEQNAPALLLSYARPIIASITNDSRFPAFNIPFVDFSSITLSKE